MDYKSLINDLITETSKGYIGNRTIVESCVLSFVAGLHILIEDISGVGKTTLAKSLAKASGLQFGRIQFTPDLLPGDITGMSIWDPVKREFVFKNGSIFNQFILGDEINRASPRTQSALLEAMEEKFVTVDGKSLALPKPFNVIATKNPSYYIGTFDLPESQLDRFGVLLKPGYPTSEYEKKILLDFKEQNSLDNIEPITNAEDIIKLLAKVESVNISDNILDYITEIASLTRKSENIKFGISTRGLKHLVKLSQSKALYSGRDFLIPEDIIYSSLKVIPHKIELTPEAILNNYNKLNVVDSLIKSIKIPIGIK